MDEQHHACGALRHNQYPFQLHTIDRNLDLLMKVILFYRQGIQVRAPVSIWISSLFSCCGDAVQTQHIEPTDSQRLGDLFRIPCEQT